MTTIFTKLHDYRINSADKAVRAHHSILADNLQTYTTSFGTRYEARHFAKILRNRVGMKNFNITVKGKAIKVRKKI